MAKKKAPVTKSEWQEYLRVCKKYSADWVKYVNKLEKLVKSMKPGVIIASSGPGSNPPSPPPPPPPSNP